MRQASLVFLVVAVFSISSTAHAQWIARHGLSSAEYQALFDKSTHDGYRLTTVSGYTDNGQERYVAVFEKAVGPAWVARHGMTSDEYQKTFDDLAKQGYRITSISGYAVGNSPRFAAIWEKTSGGALVAKHGMTAAQYQATFDDLVKQGYRLERVCGYVVNNVEYFAAIWEKGGSGGDWVARHNLTSEELQKQFDILNKQGYVVTDLSGYNKAGTDLYAGIWAKTSSPLRYVRHGIRASTYQAVFDNTYYQGYKPVFLQAFASGSSARFNGIWTNTNISAADMALIDGAMTSYQSTQGVTGLSLAITKNGRLVFAKGYGMANPGDAIEMSPNHSIRIWSASKPVTSVGVMKLLKTRPKLLDEKVFGPGGVLGTKYPTPAGREALNKFTVKQLLNMTSGLRSCDGESVFWSASSTIADAMSTLMNASDLVTTPPNTKYIYANTNFFFLARVIEVVSGKPYESFIRTNVLEPAGIGGTMYLGRADGQPAGPTEAVDSPQQKVNMQLFSGFGGWVARPMDLLKFLRVVDGEPNPPDILDSATHTTMTTGSSLNMGYALGWVVSGSLQAHNGCFSGGRSFLVELANGLSYAVAANSEPKNDECFWTMKGVLDPLVPKVSNYPSYDLF